MKISSSVLISGLLGLIFMSAILPSVKGLIPYRKSLWDMMQMPIITDLDPFRILEQTPLSVPNRDLVLEPLALARADWKETPRSHIITLDIPGMKKEDIKIEIEEKRVLRISGERKSEEANTIEGEKWHRVERTSGKFWRQFRLPSNANLDSIKANLENGVLKIMIEKVAEEKKQPRLVNIVEDSSSSGSSNGSGEEIKASKAEMKK